MAISNSKKGTIFDEINITPLTDIFLVLLIIMMVIAPNFQSTDNSIKMPEINSGTGFKENELTVSITKSGEFFINSDKIKDSELEEKLASLVDKAKDKVVILKADAQVKNKEIMKVMRAAQYAGFEKLTVAGEPLSQKQQNELENNSKN